MSPPCRLGGRGVLVTRPTAQAEGLCRRVEEAGGVPIGFPTIEILPAADPDAARRLLAESWEVVIFISRNAVEYALTLLPERGLAPGVLIAAVGKATASTLAAAGLAPHLVPAGGFDSESLLALPELTRVQGRRVLIVRGEGGRALLGDELSRRGADVRYAEVYRRGVPDVDVAPLLPGWRTSVGYVTVTSDEVLENLLQLVGPAGRTWLLTVPTVVMSERGAATAMELGFRTVAVAEETSDEGIVEALCRLALAPRPMR